MKKRVIILPGDGIGPEVTTEALKVLKVASEITGFKYETTEYPFGSEHYLKTGELVPESVYDEYRQQGNHRGRKTGRGCMGPCLQQSLFNDRRRQRHRAAKKRGST